MDRCGMLHLAANDPDGAILLLRKSVELSPLVIGQHYPDSLLPGLVEEERIKIRRSVGAGHPDTLRRACHLASAYLKAGKTDEAAKILAGARAIRPAGTLLEGRMRTIRYDARGRMRSTEFSVAQAEVVRGLQDSQPAKDVMAIEALLDLQRTAQGPDHESAVETLAWLAEAHEAREEFPAAERSRRAIHEIRSRTLGPEHWRTTLARGSWSKCKGEPS